jgi:hypothetical protein
MTLIAHFIPHQRPLLLSDVLVSASGVTDELMLPSGGKIPQANREGLTFTPVGLARKLVEVSPSIRAVCAGDFLQIRTLMFRLRDWFRNDDFSPDKIQQFVSHFYGPGVRADFAVIILATWQDTYAVVRLGEFIEGDSPSFGKYYAAGSGQEFFSTLMNFKSPDGPVQEVGAMQMVLTKASHMLAQEIYSGDTLKANFGGGFEIVYLAGGFHRIDKVTHMFVKVTLDGTKLRINMYPHLIKQWYEEDSLFVLSLATWEAKPGSTRGWVLPSIFAGVGPIKSLHEGPLKPDYLCIHHIFPGQDTNSHIRYE